MANRQKNWIIALGGLLAAFFIGKKIFDKTQGVNALNVNLVGVDFNKKSKTLVLMLRIINPSNTTLTLTSIVGDVIFNGSYIASLDYRKPIDISPNESKTININLLPNLEFAGIVASMLVKGVKKALSGTFVVKGNVNAEGILTPFELSKKINLVNEKPAPKKVEAKKDASDKK